MSLSQRLRGLRAEEIAADHLASCGLTVLARNLRCKAGEIDLLGRDGEVLVVVEVRQRARRDFGGSLGSVSRAKRRKIIRAARFLLNVRREWRAYRWRFDVVGIEGLPDGAHEIAWIKDAFRAT
ncbi:MAG TPA: YraN family protein [Steroidobacteraceae bacterium]|nr:YraN family protein [Steroidobacteraceae bacterium]